MFNVVLVHPEIPPNTGNIIRLCANTGTRLHLIRPLGFELDDKKLRRAGLDYHEWADVRLHESLDHFISTVQPRTLLTCSTKARRVYSDHDFEPDDALLFGPESRGLPADVLCRVPDTQRLRIPMQPGSRSLNLSNAVAVMLYEAWRQQGFSAAAP
jgi:tRNA (cytidine/uridine-2'-O-)-methyltransferase